MGKGIVEMEYLVPKGGKNKISLVYSNGFVLQPTPIC